MGEAFDFIAKYGHSPWDSPSWNNDWEREQEDKLREAGYLTIQQWNARGKTVKKGEKGIFLPCAKLMVFNEEQTQSSQRASEDASHLSSLHFETFVEASDWAKRHPGRLISPSPDGNGYIAK